MDMYRANNISNNIEKHFVRQTKDCVFFLTGKRERKTAEYHAWFDSFDNAKNWLIEFHEEKIRRMRLRLENQKSYLGNVKGLKE